MQNLLIIDTNVMFTKDINSRLLIMPDYDYDITTTNDVNDLSKQIKAVNPDKIVINAAIADSIADMDFGNISVYAYARDAKGIQIASDAGIPCYGIVNDAASLLKAVKSSNTIQVKKKEKDRDPVKPQEPQKPAKRKEVQSAPEPDDIMEDIDAPAPEPAKPKRKKPPVREEETDEYEDADEEEMPPRRNSTRRRKEEARRRDYEDDEDYEDRPVRRTRSRAEDYEERPRRSRKDTEDDDLYDDDYRRGDDRRRTRSRRDPDDEDDDEIREQFDRRRKERLRQEEEDREDQKRRNRRKIEEEVDRDVGITKKPAKVVTVYSAKGGVGKTTIACELATYLSFVADGNENYRVCIVDYNIDFGDVMNTLGLNAKKATMVHWGSDINERLDDGYRPEEIQYSKKEIESFLQRTDSGLYALLAPAKNLDSMELHKDTLEVMIDNLIYNGEFDFIVCDTGNNVRDSSTIALEKADIVLLVLTQSINTANCNNSFLRVMDSSDPDFDPDKVRIVINRATNSNVEVSVSELKEALRNRRTRKPYECVAVIQENPKVQSANDTAQPLVETKPGDKFTKSIADMASYVIGNDYVLEPPKKKGLFSGLFKKGKR